MKVKEVKVDKSVTVNLGNYESAKFGMHLIVEIEEGDSYKEIAQQLHADINDQLVEMSTYCEETD